MDMMKKDVTEKLPSDLDGLQTTIKRLHDSLEQAHAYVDDVVVRTSAARCAFLPPPYMQHLAHTEMAHLIAVHPIFLGHATSCTHLEDLSGCGAFYLCHACKFLQIPRHHRSVQKQTGSAPDEIFCCAQTGKRPADITLGRYLADTMTGIPRFGPEEFETMLTDSAQDSLLIMYLSNLVRAHLALSDRLGTAALPLL